MKWLLRYLDWIGEIMLPEKPDERSLRSARIMALILQLLSAVVIIGGVLIVSGARAAECRPFGYKTCTISGWCLNWCNEWENQQTGEKRSVPDAQVIKPVYRPPSLFAPPEYDYDYPGVMSIFRLRPERIREECHLNRDTLGCAYQYPGGARCDIWIVDDDELTRWRMPYDIVFRHEQAHCNGWKHDQPEILK